MTQPTEPAPRDFWDDRYRASDRVFKGSPNVALVEEVAGLTPGRALDLGCGEGGDAVWLARQGWHVTATDIAPTALRRVAEAAEAAGVGDRVDVQEHDLGRSFPSGRFDLVSSHFLQSPVDLPREAILRTAAAAVAPGGTLLVVGHAGPASWQGPPDPDVHYPTPEEVAAALDLPADDWETVVCTTYERELTGPDGQPATRPDCTLRLRRR